MAKYDITDGDDQKLMKAEFDGYSEEEWDKYIDVAKEKKLDFKSIGYLKTARKKARLSKYMELWLIEKTLALVQRIDEMMKDDEKNNNAIALDEFDMPVSHVTLRVA
ncbi:hypothetical protein, partial [Rhizobium leguminosarum]|uniref:hypothetical protein n=1 Tax=Rhizobium leguminosarum TaxID=384 RepID=UPI003F9878F1